jgi:hypothetical protein
MATHRKPTALSAAQQAFALRARFPKAKVKIRATQVVWTGTIQPTPISPVYTVRVTHRREQFPSVEIVSPPLDGRPGEPLPHFYREGSLCLHKGDEWTNDMFIVDTILPWTSEWLAFYEIWKATDNWYGGGESPRQDGSPLSPKDRPKPPVGEDVTDRDWRRSR